MPRKNYLTSDARRRRNQPVRETNQTIPIDPIEYLENVLDPLAYWNTFST